jgi:hypothetical protein
MRSRRGCVKRARLKDGGLTFREPGAWRETAFKGEYFDGYAAARSSLSSPRITILSALAVDDPEQRDDRGLVRCDRIQIANGYCS